MPLPWVRLDSNFWSNPKVQIMLGERDGYRAAYVWVAALAYCGQHGTNGFVAREIMPMLRCREADATMLVKHGFWHVDPGGWVINDWAEFQESTEEQEMRSRKARAAAAVRWEHAKRNPNGRRR